jgi:hypothetical protein
MNLRPYVCTGCCSQEISLHVAGSRSYVSGLLIDTRVVAMLGLRSHRDLISGKVQVDRKGRQILGAYFSVPCSLSIANFFEVVGVIFKYQLRPHFLAHQTPFCV